MKMNMKLVTLGYCAFNICCIYYVDYICSSALNLNKTRAFSTDRMKNNNFKNNNLDPNFVTGFIDAEGCFSLKVVSNPKSGKFQVQVVFSIGLHKKDRALLDLIKSFFGVGNVTDKSGRDVSTFQVSSLKDVKVLLEHFDRYPLITKKQADYELFKRAIGLIESKKHLTAEGINKLVAIKAKMNKGLSSTFKAAFPNLKPVARPLVTNQSIPHPQWLAGFTSGEGCFYVSIGKPTPSGGSAIRLRFILTQHNRDNELMGSLVEYLACGGYFPGSENQSWGTYEAKNFVDINQKIIPFFDKYPLQGEKAKDFSDFKKVALLMQSKAHLTREGLEEIIKRKSGMNTRRK